jgi:hypothetical protein
MLLLILRNSYTTCLPKTMWTRINISTLVMLLKDYCVPKYTLEIPISLFPISHILLRTMET